MYSINATFVASCNTTKVRSLDVIVPRPSTNINAKRISITRVYFGGSRNDSWMNLLCWYIFIIMLCDLVTNAQPYTVSSPIYITLFWLIKKYFLRSETREKKNRQYIYIVENIKFIYRRVLRSFSYLFRSEWKWIIYFPTMYVYCIYRIKLSKKSRNKRCSYHFLLCLLWSPHKSCYCF